MSTDTNRPDMADDSAADLQTAMPRQTQSETKIDIFNITEEIFIKAAYSQKRLAAVQSGCCTRCKDLPRFSDSRRDW